MIGVGKLRLRLWAPFLNPASRPGGPGVPAAASREGVTPGRGQAKEGLPRGLPPGEPQEVAATA